jgi:hypothetical protein
MNGSVETFYAPQIGETSRTATNGRVFIYYHGTVRLRVP